MSLTDTSRYTKTDSGPHDIPMSEAVMGAFRTDGKSPDAHC